MEHVFFKEHNLSKLTDGRELLNIVFKDKNNNEYIWTPKWIDLSNSFLVGYLTEALNSSVVIDREIDKMLEKLKKDIEPFQWVAKYVAEQNPHQSLLNELRTKLQKLMPEQPKGGVPTKE